MLLKGATLVSLDPPSVGRGDLRVAGDRIVERRVSLSAAQGEEVFDLEGRLLMPGLVNAHTHLYSALARGMPPPGSPPRNFVETLERVWWRLDRAHDAESVAVSALVGGIDAALSGTTLLIDHHSSPEFVSGSLLLVRDALERVGLRSVLCYEVTDRNGLEGRDQGVEENVSFQEKHQTPWTRGMIGAHASFTCSDETLSRLAEAVARTRSSVHVHVAEDRADVDDCRARHGIDLVERYARQELLAPRALMAHCVHLEPERIIHSQDLGAWIAHNPRSNMNNAVGHAPTAALRRAALGTDGIDQDMFAETRAAFLKMREAGRPDAATAAIQLLAGGHRLAAALFGRPFGKLDAGGPADLVLLAYPTPTPLTSENLVGHLLFGIGRCHIESVMVEGRWIVRERQLAGVDMAAEFARARDVAPRLWARMQALRVRRAELGRTQNGA